jgi:hypothetical protein
MPDKFVGLLPKSQKVTISESEKQNYGETFPRYLDSSESDLKVELDEDEMPNPMSPPPKIKWVSRGQNPKGLITIIDKVNGANITEITRQKDAVLIKLTNINSILKEAKAPLLEKKMREIIDNLTLDFDNLIRDVKTFYDFLFINNVNPDRNMLTKIFKSYIYYSYFKLLQKLFNSLNYWYHTYFDESIVVIKDEELWFRTFFPEPISILSVDEKNEITQIKNHENIFHQIKPLLIRCITIFLNTIPNYIGGIALNDDRNIKIQQPFNLDYIIVLSDKLNRDLQLELPNTKQQANQTWKCGYTILINGMSNAECQWAIPDGSFEEIGKQMDTTNKDILNRLKEIQYERSICKHGDTYKAMLARSVKGGRRTRRHHRKQKKQKKTQKRQKKHTKKNIKRHKKRTNKR